MASSMHVKWTRHTGDPTSTPVVPRIDAAASCVQSTALVRTPRTSCWWVSRVIVTDVHAGSVVVHITLIDVASNVTNQTTLEAALSAFVIALQNGTLNFTHVGVSQTIHVNLTVGGQPVVIEAQ